MIVEVKKGWRGTGPVTWAPAYRHPHHERRVRDKLVLGPGVIKTRPALNIILTRSELSLS